MGAPLPLKVARPRFLVGSIHPVGLQAETILLRRHSIGTQPDKAQRQKRKQGIAFRTNEVRKHAPENECYQAIPRNAEQLRRVNFTPRNNPHWFSSAGRGPRQFPYETWETNCLQSDDKRQERLPHLIFQSAK
jgi:hypothetical protein